jgi:ribonuclease BN (tRNA processing enzyme)
MSTVRVTVLGSGDAFASGGRHHSGYLLQGANQAVLLDCGPSTLTCLNRDRLNIDSIDLIAISHLHGDHCAGVPFVLLHYLYVNRRKRPLHIAGPPGTQDTVLDLFATMYRDIAEKPLPFELDFVTLTPGRVCEIQGTVINPFRVPHQVEEVSLGLRIQFQGRSILYSGDSGWTEELVSQSQGTDLFICECNFYQTRTTTHLDYPRLLENRQRFGCRKILLTHLGTEVLARQSELEMELAVDGLSLDV